IPRFDRNSFDGISAVIDNVDSLENYPKPSRTEYSVYFEFDGKFRSEIEITSTELEISRWKLCSQQGIT
ncbi:hypothetical protein PENTCL1PPCAC_20658, partial [Pristionchus entomophagus]